MPNPTTLDEEFPWHPPLIVPSYLEDDNVCSECGRPFTDLRSCEKCKVPNDPKETWQLVYLRSDAPEMFRVDVVDDKGNPALRGVYLFEVERKNLARMIECRNLVDGPDDYADTVDMGSGVTGLDIDKMLDAVVDVAIDKAARKVVKYLVWESLRTEELVEQVAGVLRDELRLD